MNQLKEALQSMLNAFVPTDSPLSTDAQQEAAAMARSALALPNAEPTTAISALWEAIGHHSAQVAFDKECAPGKKLCDAVKVIESMLPIPQPAIAPVAWSPAFDAMSPSQEVLVVELCAEIAGEKGCHGNLPDPVRLLEMAQELYEAERDDYASTPQPAIAPEPVWLTDADRAEIDAAMLQDKQPLPGNPLTDAREQRRQTNALRLQMNDQTGYYK